MNKSIRIQIPGEIQLADEPEMTVGRLTVRPATLEILWAARRETIEPRMMQLLVALARAQGEVVSRDSLITSCWSGRFVSDDAVNRCVAKVRRLADGKSGFRIETINRVGYRLVEIDSVPLEPAPRRLDRRLFLGGGVASVMTATIGVVILGRGADVAPPPDVEPLMAQAMAALNQCTPEGVSQGIGLLQHIVELSPDLAEAWASLALAYAVRANGKGTSNFDEADRRARSAALRALQLDPHSPYAKAALALLLPRRGHWLEVEQALRDALADRPREAIVSILLGRALLEVGRMRDGAAMLDPVVPAGQPSPAFFYARAYTLWAAGRLAEADQAIERGIALYPTYIGIWFTRFYMMLSSGRALEAIRFAENVDGRPIGIPASNFEYGLSVARALASHREADVDRALAVNRAAAREGVGHAENLIQFAALLGRIDDAFEAANDFYFGPAASRAAVRYSTEQHTYARAGDRDTALLFAPMSQSMRADPRFARLTAAIGLDHYWTQIGHQPDYLRA